MHFKNIVLSFWVSFALAVALRTMQIFFAVDSATGFFKPAYVKIGLIITVLIFIIAVLMAASSLMVRRAPVKMPKLSRKIGVASVLLAGSIAYDLSALSSTVPAWQITLTLILGSVSVLYFLALGVKCFVSFKLPQIFAVLPVLYFCAKLIYFFTAISTIALVTSNLFLLIAQAFTVLFMFEFAKLANNIDADNSYKRICFTGFLSALFCAIASIPSLLSALLSNLQTPLSSLSSHLCVFFAGVFIYLFIRRYFSGKNLKHHKRYRTHTRFIKSDHSDKFYVG